MRYEANHPISTMDLLVTFIVRCEMESSDHLAKLIPMIAECRQGSDEPSTNEFLGHVEQFARRELAERLAWEDQRDRRALGRVTKDEVL